MHGTPLFRIEVSHVVHCSLGSAVARQGTGQCALGLSPPRAGRDESRAVLAPRTDAFDGLATRSIVRLRFFAEPAAPHIDLMLYLPNTACKPVPVLLGLPCWSR